MKRLIIIGAGGHGKVVANLAIESERYSKVEFLDDREIDNCMGIPVIGKSYEWENWIENAEFFVAIGDNSLRRKYMDCFIEKQAKIATLIHPKAVVANTVEIDVGTVVMAGVVLNPDCKIGKGCIINTCSSVDHDCIVGDYTHISVGAHLAGQVKVGQNCMIGAGSTVINNITIIDNCTIVAGAVVVNDLIEVGDYKGIPAKLYKR